MHVVTGMLERKLCFWRCYLSWDHQNGRWRDLTACSPILNHCTEHHNQITCCWAVPVEKTLHTVSVHHKQLSGGFACLAHSDELVRFSCKCLYEWLVNILRELTNLVVNLSVHCSSPCLTLSWIRFETCLNRPDRPTPLENAASENVNSRHYSLRTYLCYRL